MSMSLAPPKTPCGSCPYRRDVPAGIWHPTEYAKLLAYDADTWAQPTKAFLCHQADGCLCGGWLLTHGVRNLLALRVPRDFDPSVWEYNPGVAVWATAAEAVTHGLSGVAAPSPAAQRKMAGLVRQRRRNRLKKRISACTTA